MFVQSKSRWIWKTSNGLLQVKLVGWIQFFGCCARYGHVTRGSKKMKKITTNTSDTYIQLLSCQELFLYISKKAGKVKEPLSFTWQAQQYTFIIMKGLYPFWVLYQNLHCMCLVICSCYRIQTGSLYWCWDDNIARWLCNRSYPLFLAKKKWMLMRGWDKMNKNNTYTFLIKLISKEKTTFHILVSSLF